jgi:hypothetical protein
MLRVSHKTPVLHAPPQQFPCDSKQNILEKISKYPNGKPAPQRDPAYEPASDPLECVENYQINACGKTSINADASPPGEMFVAF